MPVSRHVESMPVSRLKQSGRQRACKLVFKLERQQQHRIQTPFFRQERQQRLLLLFTVQP